MDVHLNPFQMYYLLMTTSSIPVKKLSILVYEMGRFPKPKIPPVATLSPFPPLKKLQTPRVSATNKSLIH